MKTKARALHVHNQDDHHAVAIGAIRVLVYERADEWFAQGIEIDYAASGVSLEDVQQRFEKGLAATAHLHLQHFSSLDQLLRFSPKEAWRKLKAKDEYHFNMVTTHNLSELEPGLQELPFGRIAYLKESRLGNEAAG